MIDVVNKPAPAHIPVNPSRNFVVDKSIIITCRTEGTKRVDGK